MADPRRGARRRQPTAAAGARKEDAAAEHWATLNAAERKVCQQNLADAKEALKKINQTAKGKSKPGSQKRKAEEEHVPPLGASYSVS